MGMGVARDKTGGRTALFLLLLAVLFPAARMARAGAALLLEEPFGMFGNMNPTGHAAVYLSHVCAATPVELRRCEPGEAGVVISRYHHISGYDWIAIPVIPYLFAVDRPDDVPEAINAQTEAAMRDSYRRAHLLAIAPDGPDGKTPGGEWVELIGAAYDRKIYSFEIETSAEQDDLLIQKLNSHSNKSHFNLLFHNCADFSRGIINFYQPHAIHRSFFTDAGMTTPKHAAESLVSYSQRHSDLLFSSFVMAQLPGTLPRSRPIRGVLESFLKSKKYSVPVALLHPYVVGSLAVVYLTSRCDPHRNFTRNLERESQPAAIIADLEANGGYASLTGAGGDR
jgi:hypothetical protein